MGREKRANTHYKDKNLIPLRKRQLISQLFRYCNGLGPKVNRYSNDLVKCIGTTLLEPSPFFLIVADHIVILGHRVILRRNLKEPVGSCLPLQKKEISIEWFLVKGVFFLGMGKKLVW